MADNFEGGDDRTEEASPERREEFREKGHIAVSREITSVVVLASSVAFLSAFLPSMADRLRSITVKQFESIASFRVSHQNILPYATDIWLKVLYIIIPIFAVTTFFSAGATLLQTRMNWSWEKLKPDFSRLNPWQGLINMVNIKAGIELAKGCLKMFAVGLISYLILKGEIIRVPNLMNVSIENTWKYWGEITQYLFWSVSALLVVIGGLDYIYNFVSLENKMKMTKQEVKEEFKRREVDPHVKARMRRMQRDASSRRMVEKTKTATVLITNPTHYSIALRYELGMAAPIVVAKGIDFLALRMREAAKEAGIPLVENKPLARTLYSNVEVDHEIPESLYKAVSEIIRYVFQLKGLSLNRRKANPQTSV